MKTISSQSDKFHLKGHYLADAKFIVSAGECERIPDRPLIEAARAAELIYRKADQHICLCLSGGVDSEAVAISFLEAKVPFRGKIMRFRNDLNWHDIKSAVEFCQARGISYDYIDVDILKFYDEKRHLDYAVKYRCHSPQVAILLHLLERIDGFPVMSWNLTGTFLTRDGKVGLYLPNELNFAYDRFLHSHSRLGVPFFFCYTPELIYSFLRHPITQAIMKQKHEFAGQVLTYENKCEIYRDSGFDVLPRENKFTGFEFVKAHYQRRNGNDWRAYDRLFRAPMEQIAPPMKTTDTAISRKFLFLEE